jgi:hypothetical protein
MAVRFRVFAVVSLAVAIAAVPVLAESYTLVLKNGNTFQTRYQPEDASWDPEKLTFLDEVGNLIALPKGDVDRITTETENRGFGHVLNSTTVAIGWAPNDAVDPDSEEGKAVIAAEDAFAAAAEGAPPIYTQEQFVEPSAATGLPITFGGGTVPPMGGVNTQPIISEPPSAPVTAPPGQ